MGKPGKRSFSLKTGFSESNGFLSASLSLTFILVFLNTSAAAQQLPVVELHDKQTKYELGKLAEILEDPSRQLTLTDVSGPSQSSRFERSQRTILNFGYASSDHWVRFKIRLKDRNQKKTWMLEAGNMFLEKIELYLIDPSGKIFYRASGEDVPYDQRETEVRAFLFQLPLEPQTEMTAYLHMSGSANKMLDLVVWESARYHRYLRVSDVILSLYFGVIFALAAYNLFLFFSISERSYLYYVLFISGTGMSQLHLSGWGKEYLNIHFLFGDFALMVYPYLATIFATLFSIRFLNIDTFYPRVSKGLRIYLVFVSLLTILGFFRSRVPYLLDVSSVAMVLVVATLVVTGILIARKGYRPARYFLVGWIIVMVGVVIMQMKHIGVFPVTLFTRYSMKFASAFEAIVFSLGLADRFHTTSVQLKMKTLESQKLAESEKMKSDFFSNITHEFRTPLMLISGHLRQLLKKRDLEEDVRTKLEVADRNTGVLNRLITQLLDISKLDSGMLKVAAHPVKVTTFFKLIIATFNSVAEHRKLIFTTAVHLPEDSVIQADEDKLEKIVYNLLSNAFKFTREGEVKLKVVLLSKPSQLLVEVTDTGRGIREQDLPKIFDRFYQATPEAADEGGTGIGLALTRELVTIMGGSIKVESKLSEGTTFRVQLPVTIAEMTTQGSSPIIENVSDALAPRRAYIKPGHAVVTEGKPIVLLVEDNYDLRQFIGEGLTDKYSLLVAVNGREGFQIAKDQIPDIILTDWMMPDMDGVHLCMNLKSHAATNHIPVILITAKNDTESKLKGLQSGADDYIYKPFEFDELAFKIANRLERQQLLQEKLRKEMMSEPSVVNDIASEDEKFLFRFKEAVEKKLSDPELSVDMLKEDLGLSRVQLSRKVNALLGIPINEYVRLMRLKKAALLLDKKWGPVSEVAYEVGFNNLSYFSKCFREFYGKTPSEYADA